MSRRDQFILQFIMWLAVGTLLFGVWAMVAGFHKPAPKPMQPASASATNGVPAAVPQ